MQNKRGLSTVVSSLLMVMLVFVVVGIVWGIVNGIIKSETDTSCFDNYGKIQLNNDYTCYSPSQMQFSVSVGDVDIDGITITISSQAPLPPFKIMETSTEIPGLKNYDNTLLVKAPGKNSGRTYIATGIAEKPDSIKIAPIINNVQCDVSDSITQIDSCSILA